MEAAADHRDGFVAEKITVASRAGGNAAADQFFFTLQPQQTRRCARGDDQSFRFIGIFSGDNSKRAFADVDFVYSPGFEFRSEFLCLLAHIFDELRPHNAIGETGIILNVRGEGELAAGLVPVKDQRFQVGARSVNRSSETGAAAADDEDVVHLEFLHLLDSALRLRDTTQSGIVAFPPPRLGMRAAKLERLFPAGGIDRHERLSL